MELSNADLDALYNLAATRGIVRAVRFLRFVDGLIAANHFVWMIHLLTRLDAGGANDRLIRLTCVDNPWCLRSDEIKCWNLGDSGVGMQIYPAGAGKNLVGWVCTFDRHYTGWVSQEEIVLCYQSEQDGPFHQLPATSQIFLQYLSEMIMWVKCHRGEKAIREAMSRRLEGIRTDQNRAWDQARQAAEGLAAAFAQLEGPR